jgi:hypothetical protein
MKEIYRLENELEEVKNLTTLCTAAAEIVCEELSAEGVSTGTQEICGALLGGLIRVKSILAGVDELVSEIRKEQRQTAQGGANHV